MQPYSLVTSSENQLGIGKLISFDHSQATVEYFSSVAKRQTIVVPLASLQWFKLPPQTRCYIHHPKTNNWLIGRVYEWDGENKLYRIDLPDAQTTNASETIIYVRCLVSVDDPIDILSIKAHETPYFHNLRSRLVATLVKQRAISQGMTGLLSANIDLNPQSVAVIQRVLRDPFPRYLLANEVSQDSPIAAGVILRQFLQDNPTAKALIIVPPYLVEQWQSELTAKVYLSDFEERVTIQSSGEQKLGQSYQLLLIDEAHHIASMGNSANPVIQDHFKRIQRLCQRCDCLLLLSSLSVLNNESSFLAMLHLLEPKSYPLSSLEKFKKKVENCQAIGRLLLSLNSEDNLTNLQTYFPQDQRLVTLIKESEGGLETTEQRLHTIRTYISDTYSLHHRFLRTRPQGKLERNADYKLEYDLDERSYDILEQLEKWRNLAPKQDYEEIFVLFYQGSSTWLGILQKLIEARLKGVVAKELSQDFPGDSLEKLTKVEKFTGEIEILTDLLKILETPSEDGDRVELLRILLLYHLADILQLQSFRGDLNKLTERIKSRITRPFATDKFPKLVIFTSFNQSAKVIIKMLSETFGSDAVVSHCQGDSVEKNLTKFKNEPQCFLLVCDRTGTTGKSLQFINGVIHFDLPLSIQQLEQRLKRCEHSPSWLLSGLDDPQSLEGAWYQLLNEGFNIFHRSVVDLALYTDTKLPEIQNLLFQSGSGGILDIIPTIKEEICQEELKISEQNILEEIDVYEPSFWKYFQELVAYDNQDEVIEKAVEGWICNVLKFNRKYSENLQDVRSYQLTKRTLIPRQELSSFFADSGLPLGVYKRERANQYPQAHLYRLGETFIDHLYTYLQWDDRGQAFALLRVNEDLEWVGFRFDYLVEADLSHVQSILEESKLNSKAIEHQADGLFPPHIETIFVDIDFNPVEDEELIKILTRPYNKSKDYSLAKSRLAILDDFIEPTQWEKVCNKARQKSETLLRDKKDFGALCQEKGNQAQEKFDDYIYQLQQRLSYYPSPQLEEELRVELSLKENLLKGIYHPRLKPDSVGFIVISNQIPCE